MVLFEGVADNVELPLLGGTGGTLFELGVAVVVAEGEHLRNKKKNFKSLFKGAADNVELPLFVFRGTRGTLFELGVALVVDEGEHLKN